jgi:hypothetical protein
MSAPSRSVHRHLDDGRLRSFSSRDDLVAALGHGAEGDRPGDVVWADVFQTWVAQGATACRFAQYRALHPATAGYASRIVPAVPSSDDLDDLQDWLADSAATAVFLHVPAAVDAHQVATLIATLARDPRWFAHEIEPAAPDPEGVHIALRWPIPGTGWHSEVLGFAPLDEVPFTRRAPVTTLVLRTIPAGPDADSTTVHLAQIPYLDAEVAHVDARWQGTLADKAALLGGELVHAAEAPITLRLPACAWRLALAQTDSRR